MDDALLEQLLNEEESASLDFKRDQYPFAGATDKEKSELLKDILAFVNAWRRDTAYILIGVNEVRGGRSTPVGLTDHLNDHDLQQFINGKTNRPVTFRYIAYPFQGLQLGILEIPIQERPLYLAKRFGGLPENVVFVRRSSSTDVAKPAEIASMGAASMVASSPTPTVSLEWGEPHSRSLLGSVAAIAVEVLDPKLHPDTIGPVSPMALLGAGDPDSAYRRKLVTFAFESRIVHPLYLVVHNRGQVPAQRVTISGSIAKTAGLRLTDFPPHRPARMSLGIDPSSLRFRSPLPHSSPDLDEHADHWTLRISFGTVLPGQTVWSEAPLYVGADRSIRVDLPLLVMAENIPVPFEVILSVEVSATTRPMDSTTLKIRSRTESGGIGSIRPPRGFFTEVTTTALGSAACARRSREVLEVAP